MKYRRGIYYSAEQRAEIWDRWQRGESMRSIGRAFDRQSSSVFSVISPTGGIRPPDRRRGRSALSLSEREEISRGFSTKQSLRAIARQLGRAPSTISREVRRNWEGDLIGGSKNSNVATLNHPDPAYYDLAVETKMEFAAAGSPEDQVVEQAIARDLIANHKAGMPQAEATMQAFLQCVAYTNEFANWSSEAYPPIPPVRREQHRGQIVCGQ